MMEPIARIEAALTRLGAEHEPPAGWEARVLAKAATLTPSARRKVTWWWWFVVPAVAAAVALVVVFPRSANDLPLQLALATDEAGAVVRGDSAHVDDVVHATATGGGPYRAVWIYHRDRDALVVACPGDPAQCRVSDTSTSARVTLSSIGEYVIVALSSRSPISTPAGTFDLDLARARDAGVIEKVERLTVR